MADIVNLRQVRKAKAHRDAEKKAAANRVAFGRLKSEREQSASEKELVERRIDGHRRDTDDSGGTND